MKYVQLYLLYHYAGASDVKTIENWELHLDNVDNFFSEMIHLLDAGASSFEDQVEDSHFKTRVILTFWV